MYSLTGDQVSKKGGMTGGFYDHRRSKLKFMHIIMQNTKSINMKEEELEKVKKMLEDILLENDFIYMQSSSFIAITLIYFHYKIRFSGYLIARVKQKHLD